jgi:DNA modification methylase
MITIQCKSADTLPFNNLTSFQGNLKSLSDTNLKKLKKSILKHGFTVPIFVWPHQGTNYILDGHQRLATLKSLQDEGFDIPDLPVDYIYADDEMQAKEKLLQITSQYGDFTIEGFQEFTQGIDLDFDTIRLTAGEFDLSSLLEDKDTVGDDEAPELDEDGEPDSQLGEIYELGPHRLMCGDSTDSEQVGRLMGGEKADMVFTDPPYGMFLDTDYTSMKSDFKKTKGGKKYNNVIGDNLDFKPDLINTVFENFGYCKEIFLWGADYYSELIKNKNEGSWVVWDKRLDESADKMYGSTFELCWSKTRHKRMLARVKWAGIFGLPQEFDKKRQHPTQKPTKLLEWFFDYYSLKDKKIIVDIYGGSGSTLIACAKTNRQCRMMELDPKYCDVIRKRWTKWARENGQEVGSGCLEDKEI